MANIPLKQTDSPAPDSVTPIDPEQVDLFNHITGSDAILEADLPDYDDLFELHNTTYSIQQGLIELVREDAGGVEPYFAPKDANSSEAFKIAFGVPDDQSERMIFKASDPAAAVTKYAALNIELTFEEDDGTPIAS